MNRSAKFLELLEEQEYQTIYSIYNKHMSKFEKLFDKLNLKAEEEEKVDDDESFYKITGSKESLKKFYMKITGEFSSKDITKAK